MILATVLENGSLLIDEATVSDSVNFLEMQFIFTDSWNGLGRAVVFSNGETSATVDLDAENKCVVPSEVIAEPEFNVLVLGMNEDIRAITAYGTVTVEASGYSLGDIVPEPTADEYSQLLSLYNETKEIAESVRRDADNGLFKGETGERGPRGYSGCFPKAVLPFAPCVTVQANTETIIGQLEGDIIIELGAETEGYSSEWVIILSQAPTPYNVALPPINWQQGIAPVLGSNSITEIRLCYIGNILTGIWHQP